MQPAGFHADVDVNDRIALVRPASVEAPHAVDASLVLVLALNVEVHAARIEQVSAGTIGPPVAPVELIPEPLAVLRADAIAQDLGVLWVIDRQPVDLAVSGYCV